ncbi:hypothetical protein DXG01_014130 [Tephrocybe rancida]|nr:hypothetical protein DXG01_014130 [Tephrocybe rancida]
MVTAACLSPSSPNPSLMPILQVLDMCHSQHTKISTTPITMSTHSGLPYCSPDFEPYACCTLKLSVYQGGTLLRVTDVFQDLLQAVEDWTKNLELDEDDSEGLGLETAVTPSMCSLEGLVPVPEQSRHATLQAGVHTQHAAEYKQCHCQALCAKHAVLSPYNHRVRTSPTVKAQLYANPIHVELDAEDLPHAKSGTWIGQCGLPNKVTLEVAKLIRQGFLIIQWDGRTPCTILDSEDWAIICLAGRPLSSEWDDTVIPGAGSSMGDAQWKAEDCGAVSEEDMNHCHGNFTTFVTGVSFSGGAQQPGNLKASTGQVPIIKSLRADQNLQRIAGFQLSCMACFAPKLYKVYATNLMKLFDFHPELCHTFKNSIFPACTFNCGPTACTFHHVDYNNLPFGLCAITALGNYDPTCGGHLILYGLKLIIEFPPGTTVLIPSGTIEHGNTPVGPEETRMSFTQYAAGGLFRWVPYGFKSVSQTLGGKHGKVAKAIRLAFDLETISRFFQSLRFLSHHSK